MADFPIPDNEADRLRSLKELHILFTPAEERFDRITRTARNALNVESAAINFIDEDRQWGKSSAGIEDTEGTRDASFCSHAIMDDSITEVPDARDDDRFRNSSFVTGEPHIRFYMGCPVHAPDGHRIGTLCVFDPEPRDSGERERELLEDLASMVDAELERQEINRSRVQLHQELEEAERRSRIDDLTNLWNRKFTFELLKYELNRTRREDQPITVAMIDIDDFKEINDTHGHPAGDAVLQVVAQKFREAVRDYDILGRYGGEEFLAVFPGADEERAQVIAERLRSSVEEADVEVDSASIRVTVSIGLTINGPDDAYEPMTCVNQADNALYEAKEARKNSIRVFSET